MSKNKKSLAETHPEVAKQWHPTKNGDLTPNNVTPGSNKKVWWKCEKGDDHEWDAVIAKRANGRRCPVCSGHKTVLSNCLATINPNIAKQWHPTKNGDLTPYNISKYSEKKVWWKCEMGDDHQWESRIKDRSLGNNCPVCSGHKTVLSNCLATINPNIAKQWHPTKNGDLTPFDITENSNKKVWWKCEKGDDHEWRTAVSTRSSGNGCPICRGRVIVKSNCLATTHPEIAKQWHPTNNGDLTPYDVFSRTSKNIWWKCEKADDHEWLVAVRNRVGGSNCPMCSGHKVVKSNSLATTHPEIAKQWHPTKNGDLTPYDVTFGSAKKVWWKCDEGDDHEWFAGVAHRAGCAVCSGHKVVKSNCLATTHPEIAKQWHPTKNGDLTPYDVTKGSGKKFWWKCNKADDHEWKSIIGGGCNVCSGHKVVKSNCLATTHPEIAKQWHSTKNGDLTPNDITLGYGKVWWKCDKGEDHEWRTEVSTRVYYDAGCGVCSNRTVVKSNCLATTHPEIAKQWHPTKNGDLTPYDVTKGSGKKIWWKCNKADDHEWRTSSNSRSMGTNCPFCTLTPQSKQELTITFELMKLFKNIDPKGLKTSLGGKLRAIDIFIPKLNLCVEFDGAYWHKDKRDIDKIKSEMLFEEGFKLIRVREEPLKKIYDTDVISKQPYNGKQVTNDILSMILSIFELDAKLVSKIKAYQSKDGLQNEKGLERYIDKILTEKAKKE